VAPVPGGENLIHLKASRRFSGESWPHVLRRFVMNGINRAVAPSVKLSG
jgi:hypothetical protein